MLGAHTTGAAGFDRSGVPSASRRESRCFRLARGLEARLAAGHAGAGQVQAEPSGRTKRCRQRTTIHAATLGRPEGNR
jgi:hypothetical protein